MMKARTIIALEPDQFFLLKRLAMADQTSVSALIRRAVNLLLEEKKTNPAELILKSSLDIAKSYPPKFKSEKNLSKKIDKIVYG